MEEDMIQEVNDSVVHQAWKELPLEVQNLLKSKYLLKQKDSEIAGTLGIQANSVRMALTRAKRIFKNKLLILYKTKM